MKLWKWLWASTFSPLAIMFFTLCAQNVMQIKLSICLLNGLVNCESFIQFNVSILMLFIFCTLLIREKTTTTNPCQLGWTMQSDSVFFNEKPKNINWYCRWVCATILITLLVVPLCCRWQTQKGLTQCHVQFQFNELMKLSSEGAVCDNCATVQPVFQFPLC